MALATATWFISLGSSLHAQTVATLEVGGSVVEYDGFLVSGAALVSPALRYNGPNLSVGTQGTWVLFESGNSVWQGTAAAAWLTPARGRWRAELSGSAGLSKYSGAPGSGHVLWRARLHYLRGRRGGWVSAALGNTFADSSLAAYEVGAGAWVVRHPFSFAGTATGTWLSGEAYADLVGTARWTSGSFHLDGHLGARNGNDLLGVDPGVYGELSFVTSLNQSLELALSGGRYPSDPVRGVVGATFVTLGLRLRLFTDPITPPPALTRALVRAADVFAESPHGSNARLELVLDDDPATIRVSLPGATTMELMGDFTDWQPVSLTRIARGIWELQRTLQPGVHRLNIRVDGGPWAVPRGTRLVETEFGIPVGVVVVP